MIGGQTGVAGHLHIGNGVQCGGKSGIFADVPDNTKLMGAPAFEGHEFKRSYVYFRNLPKVMKEMNDLKKQVAELQAQLEKK